MIEGAQVVQVHLHTELGAAVTCETVEHVRHGHCEGLGKEDRKPLPWLVLDFLPTKISYCSDRKVGKLLHRSVAFETQNEVSFEQGYVEFSTWEHVPSSGVGMTLPTQRIVRLKDKSSFHLLTIWSPGPHGSRKMGHTCLPLAHDDAAISMHPDLHLSRCGVLVRQPVASHNLCPGVLQYIFQRRRDGPSPIREHGSDRLPEFPILVKGEENDGNPLEVWLAAIFRVSKLFQTHSPIHVPIT
mmetsp:Transcript_22169/g.52721  ORF Transcript_22169/g.52721 Transcript_22169/m.52721 type:complete len:242 (-) Transcript_22169:423-1148(-)